MVIVNPKYYDICVPYKGDVTGEIMTSEALSEKEMITVRFERNRCIYEIDCIVENVVNDLYQIRGKTLNITDGLEWLN